MTKLQSFLLWIDIKAFVIITLGNCHPGETISAASWSLKLDKKWQGKLAVPIIDVLARLCLDGLNHCERAYKWQKDLYKVTP